MANLISHSSYGEEFEDMIESLSDVQLAGLPEGSIVTIVETWAILRRAGTTDQEIFARIEDHRSRFFPPGKLPTPLDLMSYVKYRIAIEHTQGAPINGVFIESAVEAAKEAYGA